MHKAQLPLIELCLAMQAQHSRASYPLQAFCEAVEHRLAQIPAHRRDKPDSRPFAYVGYAVKIAARVNENEDDSTSYIMSLLGHVFRYLELPYEWETFTTSFATSYDECELGECLINGLAQGYSDTGFGVAPHPAGENCFSARFSTKAHSEVQKLWWETFNFRCKETPFEFNMLREDDRHTNLEAIQLAAAAKLKKTRAAELQRLEDEVRASIPDRADSSQLQGRIRLIPSSNPIPSYLVQRLAESQARSKKAIESNYKLHADLDALKLDQ